MKSLVIMLLFWVIPIVLCVKRAEKLNRSKVTWGVLGFFFSFISVLIVYLLPAENGDAVFEMSNKVNKGYKLSIYNRFFWILPVWIVVVIVFGIALDDDGWPTVIFAVVGSILFVIITHELDSKTKAEIQKRIEKGDLNAQLELGVFLTSAGNSVENFEEAKKWLEKAVALNLEDAQSKLDECEKKLSEAKQKKAEQAAKNAQKAAEEAMRPVCKQCGCKYDYSNKWAFPPFCSRHCQTNYKIEKSSQEIIYSN